MLEFPYQSVKLIAITEPSEYLKEQGAKSPEDIIAYCARVSNPGNQDNFTTANKLIQYCLKKKHWSIFEQVDLTLEIKTTRDIGRQILRHRSFTFQEFSQRYAAVDTSSFALREARFQDQKNRQASIDINGNNESEKMLSENWARRQREVQNLVSEYYQWAIENGIAKEQARAILPEGATMSCMYMKGSLRSWINYTDLRSGVETQKEHRDIAVKAREILREHFSFIREQDNPLTRILRDAQ